MTHEPKTCAECGATCEELFLADDGSMCCEECTDEIADALADEDEADDES